MTDITLFIFIMLIFGLIFLFILILMWMEDELESFGRNEEEEGKWTRYYRGRR